MYDVLLICILGSYLICCYIFSFPVHEKYIALKVAQDIYDFEISPYFV